MASIFSVGQDVKLSVKGGGSYVDEDEKKALKFSYTKMGYLNRFMLPTFQSHKHVTLKPLKVETSTQDEIYLQSMSNSLYGFYVKCTHLVI